MSAAEIVCTLSLPKGNIKALCYFIENISSDKIIITILAADDDGVVQGIPFVHES